jgi:dolichyl-phosphooligosaccharide-protein glycotransferase
MSAPSALQRLARWPLLWEAPFLAALGAFMFWVRMLPYKALVGSGRAYFIGTDPFYHYRETLGTVRAFPKVPRWDPWTFYPYGTGTGQFGSLFDWLCAAIIVVSHGRDASEAVVQQILGVFPAILGALLIIPFFFLAKRLLGTPGAIVAAITLALLPGEFLIRSVAGYSDHHVAEDLFSILSILGVVVAVERAHAAREDFLARRRTRASLVACGFAILGGVALAANFYAWPPAILFLGILAVWLTLVVLLENGRGSDATGLVFGGVVAFVVAGALMIPSIETTFLGEYNTYGILQPALCFASALWLVLVHVASRVARQRNLSPWLVPGVVAGIVLVGFVGVQLLLADVWASLSWGLSWITGIGAPRTTLTIAEARAARYFCDASTSDYTCLSDDFGLLAPLSIFLVVAVCGFALWRRRRSDILLGLWSIVIAMASATQIRFSYYLAVNIALLTGWVAARVAEVLGLHRPADERAAAEPAKKVKGGRKTQRAATTTAVSRPVQVLAVAACLLLVVPGNVVATQHASPGWKAADITAPEGDLVLWYHGLDWMRNNTPDAGVNLGLVTPKPPAGQLYDYPATSYGVLSWWDYGHWIETTALRPPVANPFQQAAPFASLWFTERDPQQADKMLTDWVQGKGPVRYVFIDDAMATGKFGAITVWAHNNNASRDVWADQGYVTKQAFRTADGQSKDLYVPGPEYTESMMGRLYDQDGNGLPDYRLVWEDPSYEIVGNILDASDGVRCFHDVIPSGSCPVGIDSSKAAGAPPDQIIDFAGDAHGYGMIVASRLKLFERVEGAHLRGTTTPGAPVTATVSLQVNQSTFQRPLQHTVTGVAGPDGAFDLVFPYSTGDPLPPAQGGTSGIVRATGPVVVESQGRRAAVDVPDAAVLHGDVVSVSLG